MGLSLFPSPWSLYYSMYYVCTVCTLGTFPDPDPRPSKFSRNLPSYEDISLGGVACSAFPFVAIVDFRDPTPRAGPSNQATSSGLLRWKPRVEPTKSERRLHEIPWSIWIEGIQYDWWALGPEKEDNGPHMYVRTPYFRSRNINDQARPAGGEINPLSWTDLPSVWAI